MAKLFFARIAGALAVISLVVFFVSILPLLSAARSASTVPGASGITINREFKGDLLPFHAALGPALLQSDFESLKQARVQPRTEMPREIPFACDPSFSPVATPRLAYIYGRCMS